MYNFLTFDIIGDLCFGEKLSACWIGRVTTSGSRIYSKASTKMVSVFRAIRAYSSLMATPISYLMKTLPIVRAAREKHRHHNQDRVAKTFGRRED